MGVVRFPKEGNPYYPLPADYPGLNAGGQKAARLNAVRLQETPEDLVYAWSFFRNYYLRQSKNVPLYKRWCDSPPFHYEIVHDVGRYRRNAIAAPRGSAKSTILAVELPLFLALTRENFNVLLVLSLDTMVNKRMVNQLSPQLRDNELIRRDFGDVKPAQGTWNAHLMRLSNRSMIEAVPARGGSLGARPDLILPDDVEMHPVLNKVSSELVENFDRFLHNILLPMLERGGSGFYWIGSLMSTQCFLYHVVTTRTDDRFMHWNRRLLDAENDGYGGLLWPQRWPWDYLKQLEGEWGPAAYNAQMRNRPGKGDDPVLPIHPYLNAYEIEPRNEVAKRSPLDSRSVLRTWRAAGESVVPVERPLGEAVGKMFRVITMDWARCLSKTSDYVAMQVTGVSSAREHPNTWFVLDLLMDRLPGSSWVAKFWDMAIRWRCQYAGIEAVAAQSALVDTAMEYRERLGLEWSPRVMPIKYPSGLSKEDRIAGLEWRFRKGKLLLPKDMRGRWPWRELYYEFEGFTGYEGATEHDDGADAVSMVQFLVKGGRRSADDAPGAPTGYNPVEMLKRGELVTAGGVQVGLGLLPQEMTVEATTELMYRHEKQRQEALEARPRRPKPRERGRRRSWIGTP
jgi:hypothetical protein